MINKQEPEVGKDIHGESIGLRTINACIACHDDFIGDGNSLDITLNSATRLLSISVLDYPVALKAATGVSMSDFDLYLLPGQHEFLIGVDVTAISLYADGGGATVEIIERSSL
jgi:hypothetical protein